MTHSDHPARLADTTWLSDRLSHWDRNIHLRPEERPAGGSEIPQVPVLFPSWSVEWPQKWSPCLLEAQAPVPHNPVLSQACSPSNKLPPSHCHFPLPRTLQWFFGPTARLHWTAVSARPAKVLHEIIPEIPVPAGGWGGMASQSSPHTAGLACWFSDFPLLLVHEHLGAGFTFNLPLCCECPAQRPSPGTSSMGRTIPSPGQGKMRQTQLGPSRLHLWAWVWVWQESGIREGEREHSLTKQDLLTFH